MIGMPVTPLVLKIGGQRGSRTQVRTCFMTPETKGKTLLRLSCGRTCKHGNDHLVPEAVPIPVIMDITGSPGIRGMRVGSGLTIDMSAVEGVAGRAAAAHQEVLGV